MSVLFALGQLVGPLLVFGFGYWVGFRRGKAER